MMISEVKDVLLLREVFSTGIYFLLTRKDTEILESFTQNDIKLIVLKDYSKIIYTPVIYSWGEVGGHK